MTTAVETIEIADGIYEKMPETEYRPLAFANASMLKIMHAQSAKHVRHALDNPAEETDAMRLGSAAHCYILRPTDFDAEYILSELCTAKTAKGKPCDNAGKYLKAGQWVCGVHGGGCQSPKQSVLSSDEMTMVEGMEGAVMNHARSRALLTGMERQMAESVAIWTDTATGVRCKAKIDLWGYMGNTPTIADLKSCADASEEEFSWQIANNGYAMQAAFYLDGLSILNGGEWFDNFQFIAMEKTPPYVCCLWHLHQEDIALGRAQYRAALAKWKACVELNAWPGYVGGMIHVPQSYFRNEMKRV